MSTEAAIADETIAGTELRARLAKLLAMVGSPAKGERNNAVAALDRTLADNQLGWGWLADFITRASVPAAERDRFLAGVLSDRLDHATPHAWALDEGGAAFLKETRAMLRNGQSACSLGRLRRAVELSDEAIRRAR